MLFSSCFSSYMLFLFLIGYFPFGPLRHTEFISSVSFVGQFCIHYTFDLQRSWNLLVWGSSSEWLNGKSKKTSRVYVYLQGQLMVLQSKFSWCWIVPVKGIETLKAIFRRGSQEWIKWIYAAKNYLGKFCGYDY